MEIPADQIVPVAQLIGYGLLGILAAFGIWWGQRRKTTADQMVEVAGALVDSESIKQLTAAIEACNVEQAENRHAAEKGRAVMHKLSEGADDISRELEELRREMRELGNAIRKR